MNDRNSEDSFDIVSGRKHAMNLYPGNVSVVAPEVKSMVTVFGRVRYPDGQLAANTDIHNHKAKLGLTGKVSLRSISIKSIPSLPTHQLMEVSVKPIWIWIKPAAWVGDVKCALQSTIAKR